jgi:hypothetical protein
MSVLRKDTFRNLVELPPQNSIISTTFIKAGAHVQVIMTPASKDFVTHLHYPHYLKSCLLSFYNDDERRLNGIITLS